MHTDRRRLGLTAVVLIMIACLTAPAGADEAETAAAPLHPPQVLVSGLVSVAAPAFHDAEKAGIDWDGLLAEMPRAPGDEDPSRGRGFAGPDGKRLTWSSDRTKAGRIEVTKPRDGAGARYLAFYLVSDRWQKATVAATGEHLLAAALGGEKLELKKADGEDGAPPSWSGEVTLPIGKHLVVLRSLYVPETEGDWAYDLAVTPGEGSGDGSLAFDLEPIRPVDIHKVLDAPRVSRVAVCPDGGLVAVDLSAYRNGKDRERWLEIRDTADGRLVRLWRGSAAPGRVAWRPRGRTLTWQTDKDDKATLHTFDFTSGETDVVLADVEHLGRWSWAPDGGSLLYEINREPEADKRKVKRVAHPQDRQPWWRNRSHLMQVFVPGGLTRRLTAGPLSPGSWELAPDGKRLVFFRGEPDITKRPFSTTEMWLLDMVSLEAEMLVSDPWLGGATWSPDSKQLCLRGSPSAFSDLGRDLPEGVQANDYGGQLYLYDIAARRAEPITREFQPDVSGVSWSQADGHIYSRVTETQYSHVYRHKPGRDGWQRVATGIDYTNQIDLARDAPLAVVRGSGATTPGRVQVIDLKRNQARLLLDPGAADYADIVFGEVKSYVATLPDGQELDGFVYYPPDFDPDRKYPLIVYYYGGTSPVTRDFGGRYPKNIWAGQGYLVYVPEPSGATGYGQEFAARHVNDWGRLTADEVIAGAKAFLADHPFADPDRVGCIGASYGGFLTEYIVTRTDMFAAAVSHAGISSISSYWGEGLWGYGYGARALANSFPWQNRELFIEQSPLFHADKITTPLLMVHGDSDANVPVGESDQLFTALKILGRPVEYVQIVGQDHHILDHEQRIVWNDTILAFFARHLKDRPAWWDALYPEPENY